jgi:hypothetical protein
MSEENTVPHLYAKDLGNGKYLFEGKTYRPATIADKDKGKESQVFYSPENCEMRLYVLAD